MSRVAKAGECRTHGEAFTYLEADEAGNPRKVCGACRVHDRFGSAGFVLDGSPQAAKEQARIREAARRSLQRRSD